MQARYGVVTGILGAGSTPATERALTEKGDAILDLLGLNDIRDSKVGGLSYGTLKLLELGCALATDPDVLLLDEPTSGMGPEESDELGDRLLALRKEFGITMLLIEHHVPLVLSVCDHVYVLNFGRLLAEGEPTVIQTHPEVVAAYLGGSAPDALEASVEPEADVAADSDPRTTPGPGCPSPCTTRARRRSRSPPTPTSRRRRSAWSVAALQLRPRPLRPRLRRLGPPRPSARPPPAGPRRRRPPRPLPAGTAKPAAKTDPAPRRAARRPRPEETP